MEQKRIYRKYKYNSSQEIPRRTLRRWKQNISSTSQEDSLQYEPSPKRYKAWEKESKATLPYSTRKRWEEHNKNFMGEEDLNYEETLDSNNDDEVYKNALFFDENDTSSEENWSDEEDNSCSSLEEREDQNDEYPESESDSCSVYSSTSNSQSEDEESLEEDSVESCMLYRGSDITLDQAVFNVVDMWLSQNLTKTALLCQLQLLGKMLPGDNLMPKTLHKFFKYLENKFDPISIIEHYYCVDCLVYLTTKSINICSSCGNDNICNFFELDLVQQLRLLFETKHIGDIIKKYKNESEEGCITDIIDGSEYKRVNMNRNTYDLTLILYTDGISLSKSSKSNCWPLMFTIAEIPPHLRSNYIITIGLWYHTDLKPTMNLFLQPFCNKLNQLSRGIRWCDTKTKKYNISKIHAPLFVADAPARSQVQNILNFNGKYGCNLCEIKTKSCKNATRTRNIRFYPYKENLQLRTDQNMRLQALKVERVKLFHEKGVKGQTIVSSLPSLDLGTCVFPEYMHSVLLGIGKQVLNLWLTKKGPWRISKYITKIDKRLKNIRPLQAFARMPRSLSLFQTYKATEMYYWILFYSIPTLSSILPEEYYQHWILLVVCLHNLLLRKISNKTLKDTDVLLKYFVKEFQKIYGKHCMTYNVHQLLHMCLYVERWGPLWATSAFPFESHNGVLAKTAHGTKNLGKEIMNNLKISEGAINLRKMFEVPQLSFSKPHVFHTFGKSVNYELNSQESNIANTYFKDLKTLIFFSRCQIDNVIYTSLLYKKTKTNNYTIRLVHKNDKEIYGHISCFFIYCNELYFFLNVFDVNRSNRIQHKKTKTFVRHIVPFSSTSTIEIIKLSDVEEIEHVVQIENYVCKTPNNLKVVV
ncbi:uncharacterized protein LOC142219991 [Haematobia irritans]|uniref:uncharacterized protein LOC142219991 n=1 Tax=Haematobia irritans TaxID=7368 RepID=UPI003F4FEDD0